MPRGLLLPALLATTAACGPSLGPELEPLGDERAFGLPRRVRHVPSGMELLLIAPGRFTAGSPADEAERDGDEHPRRAHLRGAFYLGETEVTVGQWRRIMEPDAAGDDDVASEEMPVGGVTWHHAQAFVERLNADGKGGWRLPTELEWEYACRAGTTTVFSFGDELSPELVCYDATRPYADGPRGERPDGPRPVKSFPPNAWGLYEMHGNLFEWCADAYVLDAREDAPAGTDPGVSRVIRGGAFSSRGDQVRSAYRDGYPPKSSGGKYGLRVVYDP